MLSMEKGVTKSISFVITLFILAILVLSGPANAFSLDLNSSSTKADVGELVSFLLNLNINTGERLPVDYFLFSLIGNANVECEFMSNGTIISGCSGMTINLLSEANFTEGNLTGNYSGNLYNWGYGYGYGYGSTAEILSYNLSLNTSGLSDGIYSTEFRVKIGSNQFTKKGANLIILIPINILNLPASSACVYENNSITISANATGSVKEVIAEVKNSGNKTTIKNGNTYSALVNNLAAGNLSWRFIVKNIADELTYGDWQEMYVVKRTKLIINPPIPNGLNNWYVTEPIFTLDNSDASQIYYRWDGTGGHIYASPFNLTDIPNPPPQTAGILKLTYWSNTTCGIEQEQVKMIDFDLTIPRLENLIPADKAIIVNKNQIISVIINDVYRENSGINEASVGMKLDNASVARIINSLTLMKVKASYSASNLSEGLHVVEIFGQDNAGHDFYGNWSFTINTSISLNLNVFSPENKNYSSKQVQFNVSTDNLASMQYFENGKLKKLCTKCTDFEKKLLFNDGVHNLTIKATDAYGNLEQENVSFFIDSKLPKIVKIEPTSNKVVNGSRFYVKYSEDNLKSMTLYYGNQSKLLNCSAGNNKNCSTNVNLAVYNGQYIDYWFIVSDEFRNISSRVARIKVDTGIPILNVTSPENANYLRRVKFNITISEKAKLEYYDNSALRLRWTSLCTNCDKYQNTKSFSAGVHNLIIRATDKAGNSAEKNIQFSII